jgi:hypothetical protein
MKTTSLIEALEARIAPAVLIGVSGKTATFTDVDGDAATVTISIGTLTAANFTTMASGAGEQLQLIDLSAGGFDGANLTVAAKKSATGDGRVHVGEIKSLGHDLGNVKVNGDLSRINAGDASATRPGVKQLAVDSFGKLGIDTQPPAGSVQSTVEGGLGAFVVKGDFVGSALFVPGTKLGSVKIGGSFIGGESSNAGVLSAGTIGSVLIGGDLRGGDGGFAGHITAGGIGSIRIGGSVVGGAGIGSGQINLQLGDLGKVTIGHSLVGGAGKFSGSIVTASGDLGRVSIGQDIVGGAGELSGWIQSSVGDLASLTVGGSVVGGVGEQSGGVFVADDLGATKIAHDVLGGVGGASGRIGTNGEIASLSIGGSLIGGDGTSGGRIFTSSVLGTLRIGHDLQGGSAGDAGSVQAMAIKSARIGGSIIGGSENSTGFLSTGAGGTAFLSVGGSVLGGSGSNSGSIRSAGDLGVVKIGHDLQGGVGSNSGFITAPKITSAFIAGSIVGGTGDLGGYISSAAGGTALVRVGGSVIGGTGAVTGWIQSAGDLGAVKIGHDLIGGSISGTDGQLVGSGFIQSAAGRIGSIFIGGSIISGHDTSTVGSLFLNASIRAVNDIGSLVVKGGLVGNSNADGDSPVIISARGQAVQGATTDLAIGRISIGGGVEFATILAGYDPVLTGVNADAQIGAVKVGGAWAASSLVAGVADTGADGFGNFFDLAIAGGNANIVSRIASITIGKLAIGTPESLAPADHFGFVAQQVGALIAGGRTFTLTAGADNFTVGPTNDLRIREVL